jgi:glycosyltransferase involved in cell wall biosynthesis
MKLLYHHRTQSEDAQGIHIHEMVQAFRDLGHKVQLAALVEFDEAGEKKIRGNCWRWLHQWMPNWLYELMGLAYNLYGYRRLCRLIRTERPDLIYERYTLNTVCGIWASRHFGIPLILEVNAPLCYEQNTLGRLTFKRLARFTERWICSHSTWTIVISKTLKDLLAQGGVSTEKIIVMPNGIDPQKFHPGISGEAVRRRYGLEGKLIVGFVGWFRKWHGLEMLLESLLEIQLADKGVRLLLVGDGPAYPELYRYAKMHDLLSTVTFTGPIRRQEIAAHIAAMDIAVQPSVTEYACPMKILEYMGMGKCIIAPDQPNVRELLEDGVSGYLFRPSARDSFKKVLVNAVYHSNGRRSVGQYAYKKIHQERYLWEANAEKVVALVLRNAESWQAGLVMGKRGKPRRRLHIRNS